MKVDELMDRSLALPRQERAALAQRLLLSLDEEGLEDEEAVRQSWAQELDRRVDAIDAGQGELKEWSQAVQDIRESLPRNRRQS